MEFSVAALIGLLDRIGIVAFAFSGVEVGFRRRLDVFGLLVMGVVTATGGGLMRDVLIGRTPLVLTKADYLIWAVGVTIASILLVSAERRVPRVPLAIADAAGLGVFAAAGALAAIQHDLPLPAVIVLAILTATGGGILRDLLAARVPLVLHSEINATAAALGGFTVWLVHPYSATGAAVAGAAVTATMRGVGIALRLHLPTFGTPARRPRPVATGPRRNRAK